MAICIACDVCYLTCSQALPYTCQTGLLPVDVQLSRSVCHAALTGDRHSLRRLTSELRHHLRGKLSCQDACKALASAYSRP